MKSCPRPATFLHKPGWKFAFRRTAKGRKMGVDLVLFAGFALPCTYPLPRLVAPPVPYGASRPRRGPGANVSFLPMKDIARPGGRDLPTACGVTSPVPQAHWTGMPLHLLWPPRVSLELVHVWSSSGLGPACPELSILRWSPPGEAPGDTLRHLGARSIGDRDAHSLELPRQEPVSPGDPGTSLPPAPRASSFT